MDVYKRRVSLNVLRSDRTRIISDTLAQFGRRDRPLQVIAKQLKLPRSEFSKGSWCKQELGTLATLEFVATDDTCQKFKN